MFISLMLPFTNLLLPLRLLLEEDPNNKQKKKKKKTCKPFEVRLRRAAGGGRRRAAAGARSLPAPTPHCTRGHATRRGPPCLGPAATAACEAAKEDGGGETKEGGEMARVKYRKEWRGWGRREVAGGCRGWPGSMGGRPAGSDDARAHFGETNKNKERMRERKKEERKKEWCFDADRGEMIMSSGDMEEIFST